MSLFRILGPVEFGPAPGIAPPLTSQKTRALLAALLLHPNQWVPRTRLIEFLWSDPRPSADPNLRSYATRLRRALHAAAPGFGDRLAAGRGYGYRLRTAPRDVDAWRFLRLAEQGRTALTHGDHAAAVTALTAALRLWRDTPGADLPDTLRFREHLEVFRHRHHHARTDLYEARLRLGETTAPLVAGLRALAVEEPFAERPVRLLMSALHRSGEPAGALAAYHAYRRRLAEETGADPSADLQRLYLRLLRQPTAEVEGY